MLDVSGNFRNCGWNIYFHWCMWGAWNCFYCVLLTYFCYLYSHLVIVSGFGEAWRRWSKIYHLIQIGRWHDHHLWTTSTKFWHNWRKVLGANTNSKARIGARQTSVLRTWWHVYRICYSNIQPQICDHQCWRVRADIHGRASTAILK